jgi:type III restriction/modification enzyme restriction subunit/RAD3-like DEAD/DEAH box helicase
MAKLPVPSKPSPPPKTPEDLYDALQGTDSAVRHLWAHQADALRTYYEEHRDTADIALEFPTGAGKTLVGLLIAEWRRRTLSERTAFVCPNNQLAHQAATKAWGYGVDVVLLIGSHREWDDNDRAAFEAGTAVAVTNYHHIFNSDPKIDAQALVLDDAHAGEPMVAGRWAIEATRGTMLYEGLRDSVEDTLPRHIAGLLREEGADPRVRYAVELVAPTVVAHRQADIARILDDLVAPGSANAYAWRSVRPGLASCLMFVSWSGIQLRPLIAPSSTLPEFHDLRQRVYMSATLGQAGELERSFGVEEIKRIPLPRGWERQGSGRRLPLFPSLVGEPDVLETVRAAVAAADHSLIIVPSGHYVDEAIGAFVPDEMPVLLKDDVARDFNAFTGEGQAALVLANRYDGMDLPDEACRLVVLYRLPLGAHLQERFLFETLGAREALDERIRTRITQGMGRATRNRQDFAAVLLVGQELVSFLSREDVRASMRAELQAELDLGLYYADQGVTVADALQAFYEQGEAWRESEEHLRQAADELESLPMPGAQELASSVASEVRAWRHAWREDFVGARDHARQAAGSLSGERVKQYRALWLYLASSWAQLVAEQSGEDLDARLAAELRRDAGMAFNVLRWFPRFEGEVDAPAVGSEYAWRSERAADWIDTYRRGPRLKKALDGLVKRIGSDSYKEFEIGLETLGVCLGFESVRPNASADPDCAWRDGGSTWIAWEAKTMENPDNPLAPRDVRQASSHRNWISSQLAWPEPETSITAIVSPRDSVEPGAEAVCDPDVYLVSPELLRGVATRAVDVLTTAAALAPGLSPDQLRERIADLFAQHGLGTPDLIDELTVHPISMRPSA